MLPLPSATKRRRRSQPRSGNWWERHPAHTAAHSDSSTASRPIPATIRKQKEKSLPTRRLRRKRRDPAASPPSARVGRMLELGCLRGGKVRRDRHASPFGKDRGICGMLGLDRSYGIAAKRKPYRRIRCIPELDQNLRQLLRVARLLMVQVDCDLTNVTGS